MGGVNDDLETTTIYFQLCFSFNDVWNVNYAPEGPIDRYPLTMN
jgi:hypothetical protein